MFLFIKFLISYAEGHVYLTRQIIHIIIDVYKNYGGISSKYVCHACTQRNFYMRSLSLTPARYRFWDIADFMFSFFSLIFYLKYAGVFGLRVPSSSILSMTFTILHTYELLELRLSTRFAYL